MSFTKNARTWRGILLILLVISLIPILAIAQYNHSCADDYSYGLNLRLTLSRTHSPIAIAKAVISTIVTQYTSWQGTYSAIAVFAIQPSVWGEHYYFISTYILIGFFLWGVFSFFRSWIGKTYGRNDIADIMSCCVSILSIQMLPSPAQGFFWWNGASYYVLWHSLMLVQTSRFLTISRMEKCPTPYSAVTALIGILIAGSNYITALLTLEISALLLVYCIVNRRCWKSVGVIFLLTLAGFLVSVTAPGNAIRQEYFIALSPVSAIFTSFKTALKWAIDWTSPLLIIVMVFLIPFLISIRPSIQAYKFKLPLWIKIVMLLCLFASSFTPTLYAGNGIGADRVQNIRYFIWVIICIASEYFLVQHIISWIKKINHMFLIDRLLHWFTPKKAALFFSVLIASSVLFATVSLHNNDADAFTSTSAAYSIYTGAAKEYDYIADKRLQILLSDEENVVLEPYSVKPYVLFFDDITESAEDWKNKSMAAFYNKESVVLGMNQ